MNLSDAKNLAVNLMSQNGLTGWSFEFSRAKRLFGYCHWDKKTISLSRYLVDLNEESEVRTTILHEIAHALAPRNEGHGNLWAATCVKLGIAPVRCYDSAEGSRNVVVPEPRFYYGCSNCNARIGRFKRSRRGVACSACCQKYNHGKYDEKYLLVEVA